MADRQMRQLRTVGTKFETREDSGALSIEGYFAVFDSVYEIAPGMSESIAPGAFNNTLSGDIRALINHDTTLVLGRTKANTLQLKTDAHGLWGHIDINPNDSDAMNLYNRVQRGDVDQCSFGFDILNEETDFHEDGSVYSLSDARAVANNPNLKLVEKHVLPDCFDRVAAMSEV